MVGTKTSKMLHRMGKGDSALSRMRGLIRALTCTAALGLVAAPIQASTLSQACSQLNPGSAAVRCQRHGCQPELLPRHAGLQRCGESENYGPEQEHLNNVFGARLRITSLRLAVGPGIELLEYLAPPGGRAAPADEHSNDLVHHQTRMIVADIESLARSLNSGRFVLISPGVISTPKAELGFRSGLLVRDPDGHPMELVEQ